MKQLTLKVRQRKLTKTKTTQGAFEAPFMRVEYVFRNFIYDPQVQNKDQLVPMHADFGHRIIPVSVPQAQNQ